MPSEIKTENRFQNCVAMKLHLDETQEAAKKGLLNVLKSSTQEQHIDLSLTIVFNGEEEIKIPAAHALGFPNGKAKFGICTGKLSISFNQCKILLETIELGKPFNVFIDLEKTTESTEAAKVKASLQKNLSGELTESQKETIKSQNKAYQVTDSGFENHHSWKFEVKDGSPCLIGSLTKQSLGKIERNQQSYSVKARFITDSNSIRLTGGKLGLTKDISRNKRALIERAIALRFIAPQLEPSLSEVEWHG